MVDPDQADGYKNCLPVVVYNAVMKQSGTPIARCNLGNDMQRVCSAALRLANGAKRWNSQVCRGTLNLNSVSDILQYRGIRVGRVLSRYLKWYFGHVWWIIVAIQRHLWFLSFDERKI